MTRGAFQTHFHATLLSAGMPPEERRALWSRWAEWAGGSRLAYSLCDPAEPLPHAERHLEVLQRLAGHEPWAHIAGYVDFAGLSLKVDARALIPRPETEELLGLLLDEEVECLDVLDWCTGSGCLALGIKHARPRWRVTGWDVSEDALSLAASNGLALGLDVSWSNVSLTLPPMGPAEAWDLVVSNPPYIHPDEKAHLDPSVRDFEPALALFAPDEDVLYFYRRLECWAGYQLRPGGMLWLECHADHALATSKLFTKSKGWRAMTIHLDFCGKERFISVQKA